MDRNSRALGRRPSLLAVTALMAASCAAPADRTPPAPAGPAGPGVAAPTDGRTAASHPYVGMWVTDDGHIRHRLLPDGRYDEARGSRESAYRGSYVIKGNRIEYVDDTGFTADGEFVAADVLHHGGYVFRRATGQRPG